MDKGVPLHGFNEGELGLVLGVLVFRARFQKRKAFYWSILGNNILFKVFYIAPKR